MMSIDYGGESWSVACGGILDSMIGCWLVNHGEYITVVDDDQDEL